MSLSRRGFLGAMLGAMAAPAIVKSENLMRVFVPKQKIIIVSRYPITSSDSIKVFKGRDAVSDAYNRMVLAQDVFGESFWPTVVIDPVTAGVPPGYKWSMNEAGILMVAP